MLPPKKNTDEISEPTFPVPAGPNQKSETPLNWVFLEKLGNEIFDELDWLPPLYEKPHAKK